MTAAVLAIARKDLLLLLRDPMALFWALGFPVLFGLFFGSIMEAGDGARRTAVSIVVVRSAAAPHAGATARALTAAGFQVALKPREAAREAVRRGEAALFVDLAPPGARPAARVGVDPSRPADVAIASYALDAVLLRAAAGGQITPPEVERVEVTAVRGEPRTGFQAVFPAMIAWGLIGCAAAFAVAVVAERSSGTLLRLYAAPLGRGAVVAGKALACALACAAVALLLSGAGLLLGVAIGDPLKYAAAVAGAVVCFVGLTQLLSVLGRTEQAVAGAGWSVLIVLAMTGGAMVPLALMPDWLGALGALSPVRWSMAALEGATFRGHGWAELARPLALLCALGAASALAAALVLRSREA